MPRRRPNMSDRLSGSSASGTTNNVTPITRGRDAFTAEAAPATAEGTAVEVSVDLIDPSPENPRSDLGDLKGLAGSIKEMGVLQPLMVRPDGDRYQLIYGHRRLAAAKLAKRTTVPVFFAGEEDQLRDHETRLVENLHREDLSPLDEARAYQQLLALGVANGQRGLAKRIEVPQTRISRRLALLQLPAEVQEQLDSERITLNDATALTKLNDDPERLARALKDASAGGGIEKAVTREVNAAKKDAELQTKLDELRAAGVSVIEDAQPYSDEDGPVPLTWLLSVDAEEHGQSNCHAATTNRWGEIVLLCVNPQAHRNTEAAEADQADDGVDQALVEQRARERAEQRAEWEARRQARAERRSFAASLVTKGNPADGAALAVHQWLAGSFLSVDDEAVAELLGLSPDTYNGKDAVDAVRAFTAKGPRNAQRAVYAIAVALAEGSLGDGDTYYESGNDFLRQQAYFHHLVAAGYQLSRFDREELDEINQALADLEAELTDADPETQGDEA